MKNMSVNTFILFAMLMTVQFANAKPNEIVTNAAYMADAPAWLTRNRTDKIIDRMQTKLEWTIRKIQVEWYKDEPTFQRNHGLGAGVLAVTNKATGKVHMGPEVNSANFDSVFGHELVHVILGQKYKDAVPGWVEEGLANYLAKHGQVNYRWLARQPFPKDVRSLSHPFTSVTVSPQYHYQASQALAEMIAKKCDMTNLLRLSVGMKMDSYLDTYCEIEDLNAEYKKWVLKKG